MGNKSTGLAVVLTLLMPSPRRVMCVCLQPWPPFLPHTAGPWAPLLLTKTCRAPECSPGTLCLNDRHKSPGWAMWPSGRIRCAAFPSVPLGSEMVRYCPPAKQKAIPSLPFSFLKFQDQMLKRCERNKTGLHKVQQVFSEVYYSWNMHWNCHISLPQGKIYSPGPLLTLGTRLDLSYNFFYTANIVSFENEAHIFVHLTHPLGDYVGFKFPLILKLLCCFTHIVSCRVLPLHEGLHKYTTI